ncbi:ParB/RepB/Spo0J family partition protein [Candidatus Microgenomates bacterium]|nr:ParB/RepB/Spo0J family partition protein [Candidatus Microgenomates bacterium]
MVEAKIPELDPEQLQPNPLQARLSITPESLEELVISIREHGILEPIVVAKTPAGYQIIAGERRWRASKVLGLEKVPVVIRETSTRGMLELALVENVQREDLNAIDRAKAFSRLVEEFGLPIIEVAQRIGKSSSYISNSIRLLSLPDAIKDGLLSGAISEGHARAISGLGEPELKISAYKTILAQDASVRDAEELARRIKAKKGIKQKKKGGEALSEEFLSMTEDLNKSVGGKVKIKQSTVQATVKVTFKGDYSETTKAIKNLYKKLTS